MVARGPIVDKNGEGETSCTFRNWGRNAVWACSRAHIVAFSEWAPTFADTPRSRTRNPEKEVSTARLDRLHGALAILVCGLIALCLFFYFRGRPAAPSPDKAPGDGAPSAPAISGSSERPTHSPPSAA